MNSLVSLFGATGNYDHKRLISWINRFTSNREKLFIELLLAISRHEDLARLLALTDRPKTKGAQRALELEAIRLACRLAVDLSGWPQFQRFKFHPLSTCWALTHRMKDHSLVDHDIPEELLADRYFSMESEKILEEWLHWHFFWCLAKCFVDVAPPLPAIELPNVPWVTTALPILQEAARFAGQRLRRGDSVGFGHVWRFLSGLVRGTGHEDRSAEFCLRRALGNIAIDLGLLDASRYGSIPVSISDVRAATDSGYFYTGQLITRSLKRSEHLLSIEDTTEYISRELDSLAKAVTPFNERVEQYFDLADFAWLYGVRSLTERSVRGAARCILGYGAHKDFWVFRVLEAIGVCGKSKLPQCDGWVRRIAPAVEQISEFTDGDDVHYARELFAELLLDINPTFYTAYYQSLMRHAEWRLADDVFELFLKSATPSKPLRALIGTAFEGTTLNILLGRQGTPLEETARDQLANLGQHKPRLRESHSSPDSLKELQFDAATYPPDKFAEFLDLLRGKDRVLYDSKSVNRWFEYWLGRQPADVLTLMEKEFAKNDVGSAFSDIPDRLFETAMRLHGKEKAYRWLVLGHIHNNGWSSEYSRGTEYRYRRRFELVAKHYLDKWREFIKETSLPSRPERHWEDTIIIGNSRLVEFLLIVDQPESAIAITETLVSCFERELIEQPLPAANWLNQCSMDHAQILRLLFARLGLPVPTVRWWTYCQIATLIDDTDTAESTLAELFNRLSFTQLESEAVELLTPLLLVKRPIGKSPAQLRSAINRPSVLSDHIVSLIYKETVVVPSWLSAHSGQVPQGFSIDDEERKGWSSRVRKGVVPLLERLGNRNGESIVEQFEYEFVMLRKRHNILHGAMDYFAGGYYRNKITGPRDEQEDHLWRSAYLRAVANAVSEKDMPYEIAVLVCRDLMPLSRWLMKLRPPARIPTWLPALRN